MSWAGVGGGCGPPLSRLQLLTSAPCPHRLLGPQRVFDLQQNLGGINVSSGCAPAPRPQTAEQAPQGLRAMVSRKVGREHSVWRSRGRVGSGPQASPRAHPVPQASRRSSRHPAQDPACSPLQSLRTSRDAYRFGGPLSSHLEFAGVPAPPGDW